MIVGRWGSYNPFGLIFVALSMFFVLLGAFMFIFWLATGHL